MDNFESSSLSRLNDGDKAELQKFLANEQQRSSIQTGKTVFTFRDAQIDADMLEEVCDQQHQGLEARQIGGELPRQLRRPVLGPQPSDDQASQQHALLGQ
ncbi:hypothetical protein LLEC1_00255 [Akanthomyces lecanii]|uniref:Uncharacterized protein n=1 Tax=Cordyceps confragosa TaxID=2714763 RepID=A0A179HZA3_CORDF|nr:hypothetical protein LLEC1_00255 [Akanthomyces lecanii]